MPETKIFQRDNCQTGKRENAAIDTYRILDSCKDKDCYEEVRVLLTDFGQEMLEKCGSVKVTDTKVLWCDIFSEPIRFNNGFYQITIRFFVKLTLELCICGKPQIVEGLAVTEKKVVLFGGQGNVSVFRSVGDRKDTCSGKAETISTEKPVIVVETVDPIALSVHVRDCGCPCNCFCSSEEIPACVMEHLQGALSDAVGMGGKILTVSLGFFSVVRVERPSQMIVTATEYAVPDKICDKPFEDDPCAIFARMSFPVSEFTNCGVPDPCRCTDSCCRQESGASGCACGS